MKTKFLAIFAVAVLAYVTLSSRSGGPGTVASLEVSGIPGTNTCSSCHSGGTFNPTTAVTIQKGGSNVTQVMADSVYDITITVTAGSGSPNAYGFQAIFVSDSANQNLGTFQNLASGQQTKTFANGRVACEHSTPSTSNTFSFKWKAPAYCPGNTATLYVATNSVNMSSSTAGDSPSNTSVQVTHVESTPSALVEAPAAVLDLKLYPNPVVTDLNVNMTLENAGQYQLGIFAVNGQQVHTQTVQGVSGTNNLSVDVQNLPVGTYRLVMQDEQGRKMAKGFVKF